MNDGPHVLAEKSAEQHGEPEDQREKGDVELTLHRHRPDVLQRADRLAGAQIVRRGVGQLPVLEVAEAGQALVGKRLPACFRLDQDGQHRRGGEHHDQRGQQPADQPGDLRNRPQRRARRQRGAQQAPAEEEARQRQEDVDATGNPAEPDVEDRHQGDGDTAQAVEIVSVETRLAVAAAACGRAGLRQRAGRGRGQVIMVGGNLAEDRGRASSWSTRSQSTG